MSESTTSKKILIVGLDNSGKTSIVLSLKGQQNILSFFKINPTKGLKIEYIKALNSNFNIFDLGGQEAYRKDYLSNFNKYIEGTSKVIYVFDIQDIKRYDSALNYFQEIINKFKGSNNKEVEFSIFLHKFDRDLKETRPDITGETIEDLLKKIKEIIVGSELFYEIFRTTIYTTFEKLTIK